MTSFLKLSAIIALLLALISPQALGETNPVKDVHHSLEKMGITISGAVEIEAAYQDTETEDTSDITLATVELGIDVKPIKHFSGYIAFLFEEDETEPVEIDQGFVRIDGEDKCPFYLEAGRLYLPFGQFDTHFITDPITLDLGETRETAMVFGYAKKSLNISVGVFNGDVNKTNADDDMIDGFSAAANYSFPRTGKASISAGLSYLSNLGDSDGPTDQLSVSETVSTYVPAMAAFMTVEWNDALFGTLEYVTATDHFRAGDVTFDAGDEKQPWALNAELAYAILPTVEVGVRYGASDDAGDFLPETLYGAVVNFTPMDHVSVGLEYLAGEYEDGSDTTTLTLQLALTF